MNRASIYYITSLILLATSVCAQTPRFRRADSLTHFFIGSWGPFDDWPQGDAKYERFGKIGDAEPFRYYNLSDSLGFNAEVRKFWDYPTRRPAPRSIVVGGDREPDLDVLILEPLQLFQAFDQAFYLRFEFERHRQQTAETEYLGFLDRPGLTGRNSKSIGATFPTFLPGSSREADTVNNAIVLGRHDQAGIFADEMWNPNLFLLPDAAPAFYGRRKSRKMLLRLRVRIDQTISPSVRRPPILCIVTRTEKDDHDRIRTFSRDTIRITKAFKHIGRNFDTIDVPFIRDAANTEDRTSKMFFSFYWPKQVNATFDYMELLTARIVPDDKMERVNVGDGNFGSDKIAEGWAAAYSAEDFLDKEPLELGALVSRIKRDYLGHINYLRIGDEFPIAQGLPFKRLVKMVRDSTNGMIEVFPFTADSGIGWFGKSLPNAHVFNFEGSRLGWVDTQYYADPKMLFFDPYVFGIYIPLPKRMAGADTDSLRRWEDRFMVSATGIADNKTYPKSWDYYTRDRYMKLTQYKSVAEYLSANREAKRWTLRQNNGSHFGIDWLAGASPQLVRQRDLDTSRPQPNNFWLSFESLRPPTGPEMKVTGHLTASCGGAGLLLYLLTNPAPGKPGPNGGIMTSTGAHDSMYYSTFVKDGNGNQASATMWMGFKERYDTVVSLIPRLRKYGTTLLKAKYVGDWLASELALAPDSTKEKLPFDVMSLRTYDDAFITDLYRPALTTTPLRMNWPIGDIVADTANRTFVHISVWIDTAGGKSDTLLYIINMRTDDSYENTEVASTIDRRYISLTLKRPHVVHDILDDRSRSNGKLLTPFVGLPTSNKLTVRLLPGDGILVKLR